MCTLTLISRSHAAPGERGGVRGFRLVANRDEQRSRPAALPPRVAGHDGLDAWWPMDPQGGGTWIAINAAGIALALLNVNPAVDASSHGPVPAAQQAARRSRGLIIPSLLASRSIEDVLHRAREIELVEFPPFHLIATDGGSLVELCSGAASRDARPTLAQWDRTPRLWTSSSLGDQLVQSPRRQLFRETLAHDATPQAQDRFHRTRWEDRAHLSPMMDRANARTVSITTIEVTHGAGGVARATCTYEPIRVASGSGSSSGSSSALPIDAAWLATTLHLPLIPGTPTHA